MAAEIRVRMTAELYPSVRGIVGGGLPEKYSEWEYERQRARHGSIDRNPQPPIIVDIDIDELKQFVERTGQTGETALDNYAVAKAEKERRAGLRE